MNATQKNIIKYSLSFLLAGVLVYFAFRSVNWSEFWDGFLETRWGYVALYIVASIGALVFRMFRWQALVKPLDSQCKALTVWDANNVGNLTNVVLPGSGEIVRCGYVSSKRAGFDKVFGTVLMERIWDILAIAVLLVTVLAVNWSRFGGFFMESIWNPVVSGKSTAIWYVAAGLVLVAVFLWLVFRYKDRNKLCARIAGFFSGLGNGFTSFRQIEHKLLFAFYTVGIWFMYILMVYFILKALPAFEGCTFVDALFISAVGNLASIIPVPGGIGAYHYLVALTLSSLYGASWDAGILFATLSHELHAILIIVLGVASYLRISLQKKRSVEA